MKRYGYLLVLIGLVFPMASMAAISFPGDASLGPALKNNGAANIADHPDTDFAGSGLVHCGVATGASKGGCTITPITCKGPMLVSCQVGVGCHHTCDSEEKDGAVSSNMKANRKAASVHNPQADN